MKVLNWNGKFVDDTNPFVSEEDLGVDFSDLTISLINDANIMYDHLGFHTVKDKTQPVKDLNEYLKYNVTDFDDFTIEKRNVHFDDGFQFPIYKYQSLNDTNPYVLYVTGEPGEIHYTLKHPVCLEDCANNNQGLLSFSMKTGDQTTFMKKYANGQRYFEEEYRPGKSVYTEIADLRYLLKDYGDRSPIVKPQSAFQDQNFSPVRYIYRGIIVSEIKEGLYKIYIHDCDGRPEKVIEQEGDSLYSAYYQYMLDMGYFTATDDTKKRGGR